MIDLADPATRPPPVASLVDELAEVIGKHADFDQGAPAYELSRLVLNDAPVFEHAVRSAIGDVPIEMFHATRLLDHERVTIAAEGLRPLSFELRTERLGAARRCHPDVVDGDDVALLEAHGPLSWDDGQHVRLGQIWLIAPFDAVAVVGGLDGLFGRWGGESIAWAETERGLDGARCSAVIDRLSAASSPAVAAAAVEAHRLVDWKYVWPTLVGARLGMTRIAGEWYVSDALPISVIEVITADHDRWDDGWISGGWPGRAGSAPCSGRPGVSICENAGENRVPVAEHRQQHRGPVRVRSLRTCNEVAATGRTPHKDRCGSSKCVTSTAEPHTRHSFATCGSTSSSFWMWRSGQFSLGKGRTSATPSGARTSVRACTSSASGGAWRRFATRPALRCLIIPPQSSRCC